MLTEAKDLLDHLGHDIVISTYGNEKVIHIVALECNDCASILIDFNVDTIPCAGHMKECSNEIMIDQDKYPIENSGVFTDAGRPLCPQCAKEYTDYLESKINKK